METTSLVLVIITAIILLAIGVPIAYVFATVGLLGLGITTGFAVSITYVKLVTFWSTYGYTLAVVPLFILMGNLVGATDTLPVLFRALQPVFSRVRGGLAYIVMVVSAIFGAVSGSSVAACGVFTPITLPSMKKLGYNLNFSAGCIASAATVAVMIPPSITMVIYGVITETSVGPLLMAGVFPGLLNTFLYMLTIFFMVTIKPDLAPSKGTMEGLQAEPLKVGKTLLSLSAIGIIMLTVIGGIYSGLTTPSQAGASGAFIAFIVYLIGRNKKKDKSGFIPILMEVGAMTGVIFLILTGAMILARFLELSGFINAFVAFIIGLELPPLGVMAIIMFVYLILGQFFDPMSMLVLTLPVFFPLVVDIGFNPIWFGVVVVQLVEIGALTPPVGMNVFTVSTATKGELAPEQIFRGVLPFIFTCIIMLAILTAFPSIALWLPSKMMPT